MNSNMAKGNKNWIGSLLSADGDVSSKRVGGLFVLINIIVFCYLALFKTTVLPEYMFTSVCLLAGSLLGITAVENLFNKKKINKQQVEEDGSEQ